jgi:Homeodomain-like domain
MHKVRVLEGVRKMRFEEIYGLRSDRRLSCRQASDLLGVNERTFRRWVKRYESEGAEGLCDGRLEKASHNAASVDEVMELVVLFETRYRDFSASHFYDKYRDEHSGVRSYNWVRQQLQGHGSIQKAKKRGQHRRRREREPMKGMMLHQDGSSHAWAVESEWDLIVTMDDADSEIYSAFFVEEEGTWSSFRGVKETIVEHGLFCSMYVDRGSHYFYTPNAGGKVDIKTPTQFGRAMKQLGIELIPAYSPEARGRSERMFGTLQNRLPKELRLEGVSEMEKANLFLKEKFLPRFNQRFMVKPKETEFTAFVPWLNANMNIDDILCLQDERTVNKDNTVRYNNKILQIPANKFRPTYAKTKVSIHEYENETLSVYHGPRLIAMYESDGKMLPVSANQNVSLSRQVI